MWDEREIRRHISRNQEIQCDFDVKAFLEFALKLPVQRYNSQNMPIIARTPCVTLPALPQPGSHTLSIISAHVAGTWKIRSTKRFVTWDLRSNFQGCFFNYFLLCDSASWSFCILLVHRIPLKKKPPGLHSFDHKMWSSWPGSRTAIICKKIWQHTKTKETTRWVKSIIYLVQIQTRAAGSISVTVSFGPWTNSIQYFFQYFSFDFNSQLRIHQVCVCVSVCLHKCFLEQPKRQTHTFFEHCFFLISFSFQFNIM